MSRRAFIRLIGGAAAWPLVIGASGARTPAWAERRLARIGVLLLGNTAAPEQLPLAAELRRLGHVDGRTITYDIRAADGDLARLPALARALAAAGSDVLVGATTPAAVALAAATTEIPIVMTVVGDPVLLRLTESLSRPTRNVTGFTISTPSLAGKRLELLRELVPGLRRVLYLFAPNSPMEIVFEQQVRKAAESLGISLLAAPVTTAASVAEAFALADAPRVQAALVESNPVLVHLGGHIQNECAVRDLPAMHAWFFEVRGGALLSYGPATVENHAGAAIYIDRILRGATIAELPFQEPTTIKLVINLKTAKALRLDIPPTLLARADEVIE
jgi:putative ABC transport system substrate-binding protein